MNFIKYISDENHYKEVLTLVSQAKRLIIIDSAIGQFDNVWIGKFCKDCARRKFCADPIK